MAVVKWGVNRLEDFIFWMSDCFDLVYDVGEGRVWAFKRGASVFNALLPSLLGPALPRGPYC